MKSEKHNSVKYPLPGITTRKPQLRNNSWAKLLSQNRSGDKDSEDTRGHSGLDVSCAPVLFNLKETRKSCQNPVGNLSGYVHEQEEEKLSNMDELRQIMEEDKIDKESLHKIVEDNTRNVNDVTCSTDGYDVAQLPRATCDEEKVEPDLKRNHLPPLADMAPAKHRKIPKEKSFPRRDSKGQKDYLPSKTKEDIDWQNIFINGGFRPYESRDLPTRGELSLLKYKSWDPDGPVYCITKCAKYFGLDSEKDKEKLTPMEKEPPKRYTSLSPNYRFYPLRVPKRRKGFAPLESSTVSLMYLENPAKRYNVCNSCVVPPVTPASSMFRSSPIGWSPLPYKDRRNTLEELAELSICGQTTDEGICSPTESELGF